MTDKELHDLLSIDEGYRIERTTSTGNMDKFQEAICAFANDLPGKRQKGYLLIGVRDEHKTYDESISDIESDKSLSEIMDSLNQLEPKLKQNINTLIFSIKHHKLSIAELKLKPELKPRYGGKSSAYIMKDVITPSINLGLVSRTHPDSPRHPHQKYYLTALGKNLLKTLEIQVQE